MCWTEWLMAINTCVICNFPSFVSQYNLFFLCALICPIKVLDLHVFSLFAPVFSSPGGSVWCWVWAVAPPPVGAGLSCSVVEKAGPAPLPTRTTHCPFSHRFYTDHHYPTLLEGAASLYWKRRWAQSSSLFNHLASLRLTVPHGLYCSAGHRALRLI